METLGGLLALLCVALAGAQTLNLRERLEGKSWIFTCGLPC